MRAWWGKQFHEPKCGFGHVCRVMVWTRQQGLVPYIGFENVRGDLCYLSMRPTNARIWHKAVLRWVRLQGRGPHASGKAKSTFDPVGIPPFWAYQAPGNKPTPPKGVKAWGMAPWGRRNSPVPKHTRQNRLDVKRPTECDPTTGEERPHKRPKRASAYRRRSLFHMEERELHFCRAT